MNGERERERETFLCTFIHSFLFNKCTFRPFFKFQRKQVFFFFVICPLDGLKRLMNLSIARLWFSMLSFEEMAEVQYPWHPFRSGMILLRMFSLKTHLDERFFYFPRSSSSSLSSHCTYLLNVSVSSCVTRVRKRGAISFTWWILNRHPLLKISGAIW